MCDYSQLSKICLAHARSPPIPCFVSKSEIDATIIPDTRSLNPNSTELPLRPVMPGQYDRVKAAQVKHSPWTRWTYSISGDPEALAVLRKRSVGLIVGLERALGAC